VLLRNSLWLYFFQGTNYLSPLIIYPLLLSITNPYDFGIVAVILSVSQFYIVLIDFGASTTGVERAVKATENLKHKIIKNVQSLKLLIILFSVVLFLIILSHLDAGRPLLYYSALGCITQSLFPIWIFHSQRDLSYITKINAINKLLLLMATYFLVDDIVDFIKIWSILNSLSLILYSLIVRMRWSFNVFTFSYKSAKEEYFSSWRFASAKTATSIYTSLGAAFVGMYDLVGAGAFMMADQLYRAGQSIYNPFFQAAYPIYVKSKNLCGYLKKIKIFGCIVFCICFLLFVFSQNLIQLFYGSNLIASQVLQVFSLVLFVNYVGVSYGYNIFGIIGKLHLVNKTVLLGSLFFCVIAFFLIVLGGFSAFNTVIAILFTEVLVAIYRIILFRKEN